MTFSFSSIERAAIVENRRRVETHAERVRRRTGTSGPLDRTIRLDRLAKARATHGPDEAGRRQVQRKKVPP
jgi:hypothetical protein